MRDSVDDCTSSELPLGDGGVERGAILILWCNIGGNDPKKIAAVPCKPNEDTLTVVLPGSGFSRHRTQVHAGRYRGDAEVSI